MGRYIGDQGVVRAPQTHPWTRQLTPLSTETLTISSRGAKNDQDHCGDLKISDHDEILAMGWYMRDQGVVRAPQTHPWTRQLTRFSNETLTISSR